MRFSAVPARDPSRERSTRFTIFPHRAAVAMLHRFPDRISDRIPSRTLRWTASGASLPRSLLIINVYRHVNYSGFRPR